MKTGGNPPVFSPVGGESETAHILSLMGGGTVIQGQKSTETNTFQNRRKEVSNMAVFRIEKTRDYTVMSNHHLRDTGLSLKSKGLLSMMLSLPENWNYTTRGLAKICKEGTDSIGSALKELERAGYIVRNRLRDSKGKIVDVEYVIYETPHPPEPDGPCEEEPDTEHPDTENPYMDGTGPDAGARKLS